MVTELRAKSQITIPKQIISKLGLSEGDKLEIVEKDGAISIVPVVVYTKKEVTDLRHKVTALRKRMKTGDNAELDELEAILEKLDGGNEK